MKYNDLINELLDLLDQNEDIKKIKELKNVLLNDKKLQSDLENYHLVKTIENKQRLLNNQNYLEYLKSETNINFLIQDIKNNFILSNRKCYDESN